MTVGMKFMHDWVVQDYEDAIIAAMMVGGNSVAKKLTAMGLEPDCFSQARSKATFDAIKQIIASGDELDLMTVCERIEFESHEDYQDFLKWYFQVEERIDTESGCEQWTRKLLERYKLEREKSLYSRAAILANEDPARSREYLSEQYQEIDAIGADIARSGEESIDELLEEVRKQIDGNLAQAHIEIPLQGWNESLSDVDRNEFVVIGARPSVGKSSFGIQVAWHNLRQGKRIAMITAETTAKSVIAQAASQIVKCNRRMIHRETFSKQKEYPEVIRKLKDQVTKGNLLVIEDDNIHSIESALESFASAKGPLDAIFIDYIQLMNLQGYEKQGRFQELTAISRILKKWTMPKAFNCPVFGMAQISREVEKGERPPRNSDLKECGSFEQDANRIIFLHRPETHEGQKQFSSEIQFYQLLQSKLRDGPTGIYECEFVKQFTLFKGITEL